MHKVKLFSTPANMVGIQKLQKDLNEWLDEVKIICNAMVIHRTDMIEACGMVIYSIYYTFLPNESATKEKDITAEDTGRTG
jgi:hypothetical protein